MKTHLLKRFSFIGMSLLWSLLLYSLTIIILDWQEIKAGLGRENKVVQIVQTAISGEAAINSVKNETMVTKPKPEV